MCQLIPGHLVNKLAKKYGVQARSFTPWSHVGSILFGQLIRAVGLNDVCDALGAHSPKLAAIRAATAPSRNGLSHANKTRPAKMAQELFWEMLDHLQRQSPGLQTQLTSAKPKLSIISLGVLYSKHFLGLLFSNSTAHLN